MAPGSSSATYEPMIESVVAHERRSESGGDGSREWNRPIYGVMSVMPLEIPARRFERKWRAVVETPDNWYAELEFLCLVARRSRRVSRAQPPNLMLKFRVRVR